MASRTLARSLLSPHAARHQSTAATPPAPAPADSSSPSSSSPYRVVAAALLSRPPLVLPALSPLERSYYAYQRKIHRALSKPTSSATSWFFKKGSAAEKAFGAFDRRVDNEDNGRDERADARAFEMAGEEVEGAPEVMGCETEADRKGDLRSLERRADRTLYLLLKKKRDQHAWQFPQGAVDGTESLVDAAHRELVEETGPNVDAWPVGRVPASALEYPFPPEHRKKFPQHEAARVFFMPMRIVRGQPVPNAKEGIVDFAWLTKEEVKDKVSTEYWDAVAPALSDK
ncbi:uncharacterized protein RHOBADRAFT_55515 [Rhodotorula graminis WP1]|uniref:Large ribosomal subunit protein mL46 n=1 Tax=Rhodotorula graminis (strain WP1) TaxID=578459 RepID=A0A0P9EM43_RHOGW|nr:uncharacterized protein RHOBADRAFT_55515 [Rhodotorula graminis WP1]KPV72839.1 hypothetical protein RHOBADRAFT_55515 [Rhodotorula graminis WP1]